MAYAKRCRCVHCPGCAKRLSRLRRQWLESATRRWPNCIMLTLTVDRNGTNTGRGFESSEAAFDYVAGNHFISRMMKHVAPDLEWHAVLEWQESGFPHWHLACSGYVNINRVRHYWGDLWGIAKGRGVDVVSIPTHAAAHYLCRYLTKGGQCPEWVHDRKRVRTVNSSRNCSMTWTAFLADRGEQRRDRLAYHGVHEVDEYECVESSAERSLQMEPADDLLMERIREQREGARPSIGERVKACCQSVEIVEEQRVEYPGGQAYLRVRTLGRAEVPLEFLKQRARDESCLVDVVPEVQVDKWEECADGTFVARESHVVGTRAVQIEPEWAEAFLACPDGYGRALVLQLLKGAEDGPGIGGINGGRGDLSRGVGGPETDPGDQRHDLR